MEVEKPFPKEAELAEKSARLAELDTLLNMESRPEPEQDMSEAELDERSEGHRPSVLAGLKAATAEKPARDKPQKKEETRKMTNEQWNTTLYKQMFTEQEQFRDWLLAQPPEEILNHAYEYVMRRTFCFRWSTTT